MLKKAQTQESSDKDMPVVKRVKHTLWHESLGALRVCGSVWK